MAHSHYSFTQWKDLVSQNPLAAAESILNHFNALEPEVKRAALISIPESDKIIQDFVEAANFIDNPLGAIPFLAKDLFNIANIPTLAGSTFLQEITNTPQETAFLVENILEHKAVFCGKTQLNEFAYGLSGENAHYGNCPHPFVNHCLSGGSSSGSAWAVSKGIVPFALGTDTGGSIRVPASFCGVFGMRIPDAEYCKENMFPLSPSFDTAGWFTQNPVDMQTANSALMNLSAPLNQPQYRLLYFPDIIEITARGLARGYDQLANILGAEQDSETSAWLSHSLHGSGSAYTVLQSLEAYKVHQQWLDSMQDRYDPVVWKRIDQGRKWSAIEKEQAAAKQQTVITAFKDVFSQYDAVVMPATHTPSQSIPKLTLEYRRDLLKLNTPASMARLPVLTLPVPLANRLSGGLQVIFPDSQRASTFEILERCLEYYGS